MEIKMPIKFPNDLPAVKILNDENIFVMTETRAISQDIRPLKILLLNLMPKKIETEPNCPVFSVTLPCRWTWSLFTPKVINQKIRQPSIFSHFTKPLTM